VRRANISLKREVALSARRVLVGNQKLVYVLVSPRSIPYEFGRSKILYIGTTRNGGARIAQSVASRADHILQQHGVRSFDARIVTCSPRRRVRTWAKLERAMLLCFRELFGELPLCNARGLHMRAGDEMSYFRRERLVQVIEELS
jgi:hypothetical protein